MREKTIWVRADLAPDREARKRILTTSLESGILRIAVLPEDLESFSKLGIFEPVSIRADRVVVDGLEGPLFRISDGEDQERVAGSAGRSPFVVVDVPDWKVIPMENLVARFQGTGTRLIAIVRDPDDIDTFLGALESGADGLLLEPSDPNDVLRAASALDGTDQQRIDLVRARVTGIRPLGTGDRVCIDTCSVLDVGEGMLVGSGSAGLFLVHSESLGSDYVASRPFRVNAGPVHSYVLSNGDRTYYLSDLRVGDELLAVSADGRARRVVVGRIKIEKRPLVLVTAEHGGREYGVILQNAETVRLVSGDRAVSVADLEVGDEVAIMVSEGGRHFGTRIEESITER